MKIMFAMLKTLGDVVLGTTICLELKRDYPDSEISFFVNSAYAGILENNPYIDTVLSAPDWHYDMLFLEMVKRKYDLVYFPYQMRSECNMWHQMDAHRHQHLVDFYWKRMGKHRRIENRECYIFPSPDNLKKAESFISFDVPRIAIHSTSGVKTKDWPYFIEFTELCRKEGFGVVQVGALSDIKIDGAIDIRGRMSLIELAAFLSKCSAFVGLDSGISYIADAMKTPTIVIQGSTSPVTSGPISDRVIHLFADKTGYNDCEIVRCHVNCRHEINCNTRISPEMVMEKVLDIVNGKNIVPVGVK